MDFAPLTFDQKKEAFLALLARSVGDIEDNIQWQIDEGPGPDPELEVPEDTVQALIDDERGKLQKVQTAQEEITAAQSDRKITASLENLDQTTLESGLRDTYNNRLHPFHKFDLLYLFPNKALLKEAAKFIDNPGKYAHPKTGEFGPITEVLDVLEAKRGYVQQEFMDSDYSGFDVVLGLRLLHREMSERQATDAFQGLLVTRIKAPATFLDMSKRETTKRYIAAVEEALCKNLDEYFTYEEPGEDLDEDLITEAKPEPAN